MILYPWSGDFEFKHFIHGDMELRTKSKREGMNCAIDVFYEETPGFSTHLNDKETYKMVLVGSGSFVVEDSGEYRVITAPAAMAINEKADIKIVSENGVKSSTICFKPTFIREEFTFDALNSGKYDRFMSAVKDGDKMSVDERFHEACAGSTKFDQSYAESIHQECLLLMPFCQYQRDVLYYSLTVQEYEQANRLFLSVRYDLLEQPDSLWILRTRYFITSILFMTTADFYRNFRQCELYSDPLVAKVARYFWENLDDDITLDGLLKQFGVNKNVLNDAFYKEVSMSCMAYLEELRINLAKKYLQYDDESISEISQICGYRDSNYFTKVFKKNTGQTPSEFRKHMKGLS